MNNERCYEFTLILKDLPVMTDEASHALFEAGCDDGSPGSCDGVSSINFHRDADDLGSAIRSAIRDVRKAGFEVNGVTFDEEELASLLAEDTAAR